MSEIVKLIDSMSDSTCVTSGEQIACFDAGITSICAFTQKTGATVCGGELKTLIGDLQGHGCGECGSVPLGYPGTNAVSNGELTVNAAENNCRGNPDDDGETGLCPGISEMARGEEATLTPCEIFILPSKFVCVVKRVSIELGLTFRRIRHMPYYKGIQ